MQLESKHILRRAGKAFKLFLFSLTALLTLLPTPAHADDPMGNPGMRNLMLTIAMLNFSMQQAAENPMDQWRRQNVARMMGMMPIAIAGLAKEFQQNKLVDSQLPMVQAMLGGFIDKNVGDRYTAFVKNPSKNLIPQVGKGFPSDIMKQGASQAASSATLKFDESAKAGQPADAASAPQSINDEIANLGAVATEIKAEPMDAGPKRESASLTFDESAKAGSSEGLMPTTSGAQSNAPVFGATNSVTASGFSGELSRDLNSVESSLGYGDGLTVKRIEKQKEAFEEDLAPIKDGSKSKTRKRPGRGASFRTKLNSSYYSVRSLMEVSLALYPFAEAAGSCGGGGNGGESGAKSAETLFALAAMMAAISPMVAAAVQASADKDIAKTNANAQMAMTKMTSETSKYLADQQKGVAVQQAQIAAQISNDNQKATTDRLNMQLASLKQARETTAAQDREKFQYQQQLDQQRIALAKQQSDETIRLANTQLRAQMTQAGISQGFVRSMNSATGLTVNGGSVGLQAQQGGYGQVAANGNSGTGLITSTGSAGTSSGFTGSSAIFGGNTNSNGSTTQGRVAVVTRKAVASNALLSNLEPIEEQGVVGKWVRDPKTGKLVFVPVNGGTSSRLAVKRTATTTATRAAVMPTQASVGLALKGVMTTNTAVAGSSAQTKVKTEAPVAVATAITPNTSQSFADYLQAGAAQAATRRAVVTTTTTQPSSHSGAYAEPDMSQLDRGLMKSPRRDRTVN